ncbi:MAG: DUF4340 domain-containing protein [Defluviitaleaceae bacterium]|nr:DUF4340 domain-containing protein [Defluviitaleaceae bacterium]
MKVRKQIITIVTSVVVIGLLVGLLMWQRREVPVDEGAYNGEEAPPPQVVRIVDRTEAEIVKVVFQGEYETATMIPFMDEDDQLQWKREGVDYVLNLTETRNNIRAAFSLFSSQVIHEDVNDVPELNLDDFGFNQLIMTAHYDDGTTLNIYLGSPTIDFRGYFVMVEGDPALYTISALNAGRMRFGLDDMLDTMLPVWDVETIDYFKLVERDRGVIEFARKEHDTFEGLFYLSMIEPFPGSEVWGTSFSHHIMEHFFTFRLGDLISLHPDSFASYGLDDPSLEFIYQAPHGEAHLFFGDVFFREEGDEEVAFIYVKFADRPHVFEALFEPVQVMFGMNPLRFIARFIALVDIQTVGQIYVSTGNQDFEVHINQVEDSTDIEPTINGIDVSDSAFRVTYRLLIGLGIDYEVEPFAPVGAPLYTIRYAMFEEDDILLSLYAYDDNFHAVSVNGEEIWFVVSRRSVDLFIASLEGLLH